MDPRLQAVAEWAADALRQHSSVNVVADLEAVAGDASFRRYYRLRYRNHSWIVVDAPPEHEDSQLFMQLAKQWYSQGVRVPQPLAADTERGFMLLEDMGDTWLWHALREEPHAQEGISGWYRQAIEQLLALQQLPTRELAAYDNTLLQREMALFRDWLCQQHLQLALSEAELAMLQRTFDALAERALAQPQVVVHRDYHSRNLMVLDDGTLGILDFQDAVAGPPTYDLVSLLRDCYVHWPEAWVEELAGEYWEAARPLGIYLGDWSRFRQDFDWMGLQRHLKAAGIFARLSLRDGKHDYLNDIPNTCRYLLAVSQRYDELADFHQWLHSRVMPVLPKEVGESA
ncbi:cell wall phosphotransferase [Bacterioplanes sanyensis]|uniref:aminoglycoside phosphotransferase family protein n=1 Tax=Bacterioplanes sanyensis TaxID=1249553 RepID=UPI001674C6D7|nr:phosphotransferase [Bacterioplanes sanyensis]GGY36491.1 cell wall phosphotransferase [Bacterioplanes sanyensis]